MALDKIYDKSCAYKRAGVILSDIIPDQQVQLNLFGKYDVEKRTKLMKVYDDVNHKMGRTIRLSIQVLKTSGVKNKPQSVLVIKEVF